ncbi:hypothetical protein M9H77_03378 [Catharanthus roseus]|uniref:Uncharacterized protein n=1 Tax=Catharanthus roseus TaxID=4058 RepID=A0ACC0CB90_CATRO|nr:hypothetical protein M9H77_03378 [Catharanthus roseus]
MGGNIGSEERGKPFHPPSSPDGSHERTARSKQRRRLHLQTRAVASSSSSSAIKVVLQSIDGRTFEDRLTRTGPVVIPDVSGDILAKIIYCKRMVTKLPSDENDVELKPLSKLVNDDEQTLFGLFVVADLLNIKGLLSITCENILDMIKCKDPMYIHRVFNITPKFSPEEEERLRSANLWAFN